MINISSPQNVIRRAAADIADLVLPSVTDPAALKSLQMMAAVLQACAARVEYETDLMHAEITEIDSAADQFDGIADDPALAAARRALAEGDDGIAGRYARASEVLACAAEAALHCGDSRAQSAVYALLRGRLDNEQVLMGADFSLVGRA